LRVIKMVNEEHSVDIVASCLAAHIIPPEYSDAKSYLSDVENNLLPVVKDESLASRVDIFVEEGAFSVEEARSYLLTAKNLGFSFVIHADQFTSGGSALACEVGAKSADHLEVITDEDIKKLAESDVVATVLPGASLGLGIGFAPARKLLDAGCSVVVASDYNPGSAPMGNLLMQAAVMGAQQKLSTAETLAAITCRAAKALDLPNRGELREGNIADFISFPCADYQQIFYYQGQMLPNRVWKKGEVVWYEGI